MSEFVWQLPEIVATPKELIDLVKKYLPTSEGIFGAKLLQQRGITAKTAASFLDWQEYQPTSPDAFGQEIKLAVRRLKKAIAQSEKITIWGDFDADGVTATSLLWEGLAEFHGKSLDYYIPNRLTESHGLNKQGLEKLAAKGTKLIITCDTGSNNMAEIAYAQELGLDIIITDHHTLPEDRPEVVAILNPRYFAETHPFYHLSGVALAYKLLEGLYLEIKQTPPPETLLDLVAIGLIADLVELKGDCRYLAQKGLRQLQKQNEWQTATRLGVYYLLKKCKDNGDRPTDIGYGIGPRINAVSRIYGDSSFVVELLTAKDQKKCQQLAQKAELANSKRKELEAYTTKKVKNKLTEIDLSTTTVIVLADNRWQPGVLGLVANTIARESDRPTILLNIDGEIARGSARSTSNIDLYELVKSQVHLLESFGGHPYATGLSIRVENLPLFTAAINQVARSKINYCNCFPTLNLDLVVTVKDLGKNLFKELKLLEPYGIGNPTPQLLIKNCTFREIETDNIKITFLLKDNSTNTEFPGVWWRDHQQELPLNSTCDVVVELDYNASSEYYQVRLIDWRLADQNYFYQFRQESGLLDWRNQPQQPQNQPNISTITQSPSHWQEISKPYHLARQKGQQLALAYHQPMETEAISIWYQLIGTAKYLHRTGRSISYKRLLEKLQISDRTLQLGLKTLSQLGYILTINPDQVLTLTDFQQPLVKDDTLINSFLNILTEELFQQQYFNQVPLNIIQNIIN